MVAIGRRRNAILLEQEHTVDEEHRVEEELEGRVEEVSRLNVDRLPLFLFGI